jgi:predicted permease
MVNRFGYFVLYPSFLFTLISTANFAGADAGPFLLAVLGGFLTLVAVALSLRPFFRGNDPAYTSVFQGSVRWNGFALLAAAAGLYGEHGPGLIACVGLAGAHAQHHLCDRAVALAARAQRRCAQC